jgi:hypothetical protein
VNGFDPPHVRELRAALRRFAEEDVPQDLRIKSQRQQVPNWSAWCGGW